MIHTTCRSYHTSLYDCRSKGLIINFCLTVRLRDEEKVCQLITMLQEYLEVNGSRSEICRVYLRHIEHLYYKVSVNKIADKGRFIIYGDDWVGEKTTRPQQEILLM